MLNKKSMKRNTSKKISKYGKTGRIRKRAVSVTVLAALLVAGTLSLTACGSGETTQTYAWVLATASPEDTVTQIYSEKFAEEVEEMSGGEMRIQVYPNSSLGGDTELLESCMTGDIPFVVQNTAPQVSYLPRLCLFDLPCVFDTIDELHEVLDNEEFMEKVNDIYAEKGIELLGMSDQDFRVMTSNKMIESIDDFKGIKIRTMENSYHMEFWSAIGANPTPMSFSEVYIGLQQNTIDAQENPYEVIVSNKFYEQQKYIIQTNHLPHLLTLITNQDFMDELSEDQQEIIREAAGIAGDYAREQAQERVDERIAICEEGGSTVVAVSDELRDEMRAASADLYEEIREVVDDDELYYMYV
ncbi:MAG: TRAP transporter substrate-binding protein, partial [Clostridiales bacterium]|nr:TRAP transporter substrate-binding protein [Clostridiales bacterium]